MELLKSFGNSLLKKANIKITRDSYFRKIESSYWPKPEINLELLRKLNFTSVDDLLMNFSNCRSQFGQDLVALALNNFKREGFFVEFGATDGVLKSNTFLLEKVYGWHGILAEPSRSQHSSLKANRTATIDSRCVWKESEQSLLFNEFGDLSTIDSFSQSDVHAEIRLHGEKYTVTTVSLNDLLVQHDAPQQIDFLSIDTEGSEFEILKAFDFNSYHIRVIVCEHNFGRNRAKIKKLLESNGFNRIFSEWSGPDDYYINTLQKL